MAPGGSKHTVTCDVDAIELQIQNFNHNDEIENQPTVSPLSVSELRAARRVTVRLSCLDGQLMAKSSGMRSFLSPSLEHATRFSVCASRRLTSASAGPVFNAKLFLPRAMPRIWGRDISHTISQAHDGGMPGMDTIRYIENSRIRASNKDKVKMLFVNSFRQLTGGDSFCTRCVLPCCIATGRDYTHVQAQM